jgi:predicted nucleotidyltransferase
VEEVQEEQMQRIQLEKNCPASIFEGFRREEAMQTYEGIAMQFIRSKGYLTIQATEEGYSFIFYDSDLHEIQSGDYDNPDASIQEAAYEILKSERMDDLECVKVDYKEFEEMTIQHSKDLLQEGELRATSEIGRNELALNSLSRAEVERGVLYHAQAVLEDMGMEQEVELLAARVYGSRSRQDLYREDSDLDVVLSYKGDIREDSFFNALNESGIAMAGIKVDINPIAEERITLAEYIKESEKYLDQQEIKKLAVDLDNFSYDVDTYEYNDTVENITGSFIYINCRIVIDSSIILLIIFIVKCIIIAIFSSLDCKVLFSNLICNLYLIPVQHIFHFIYRFIYFRIQPPSDLFICMGQLIYSVFTSDKIHAFLHCFRILDTKHFFLMIWQA